VIQPIADRVAQHLEINSKNFQFSTRRTRILMGFIMYFLVLIVNPMGRILVRWKSFRNNLEMLCPPICNWLFNTWTTYEQYVSQRVHLHAHNVGEDWHGTSSEREKKKRQEEGKEGEKKEKRQGVAYSVRVLRWGFSMLVTLWTEKVWERR